MNTVIILTALAAGAYGLFVIGYMIGQDANHSKTWAAGYAAGLAKADEMWPEVKRWEMQ
jgi:coenzyme F420-reducing hydrogenase delta subunit